MIITLCFNELRDWRDKRAAKRNVYIGLILVYIEGLLRLIRRTKGLHRATERLHWTVERLKRAVFRSSFLVSISRESLYLSDMH